jgi:hypothetical protein
MNRTRVARSRTLWTREVAEYSSQRDFGKDFPSLLEPSSLEPSASRVPVRVTLGGAWDEKKPDSSPFRLLRSRRDSLVATCDAWRTGCRIRADTGGLPLVIRGSTSCFAGRPGTWTSSACTVLTSWTGWSMDFMRDTLDDRRPFRRQRRGVPLEGDGLLGVPPPSTAAVHPHGSIGHLTPSEFATRIRTEERTQGRSASEGSHVSRPGSSTNG